MVTIGEAKAAADIYEKAAKEFGLDSVTGIGLIELANGLRDLASQVESLQADAERYRFRHKSPTWDAEIDAAMESRKIEP